MLPVAPPPMTPPTYECLAAEAQKQALDPVLVLAVLKHEAGKVGRVSVNANRSLDIGPMQINSTHLKTLPAVVRMTSQDFGQRLLYDGCFNVSVGSYLLRAAINEAGGNVWRGVSYYNSHNPTYGQPYAMKVFYRYQSLRQSADLPPILLARSN